MSNTESRAFRMHPKLLWDVMTRQSGTLAKAILEGVMNSIDAGATRCELTVKADQFSISDDGKGFTEDQIKDFFENFGAPHSAGDATYGRYRMGRGQLFTFGKNIWRTNTFQMAVDIKAQMDDSVAAEQNWAIGYDLTKNASPVPGCLINVELYPENQLSPQRLVTTIREIETYVAWAQIPVILNGQQINKLPQDHKWDMETEDAYFLFRDKNTFEVYNLGVLVRSYNASQFGTGGTAVSKVAVQVNFARSDILDACPVWKSIQKTVKSNVKTKIKNPRLNETAKDGLVADALSGEISITEILGLRVLTDVTGSHLPLSILTKPVSWNKTISAAPLGDMSGERAHTSKAALVLSNSTLGRFGVDSVESLFEKLDTAVQTERAELSGRSRSIHRAALQEGDDKVRSRELLSLHMHLSAESWTICPIDELRSIFTQNHIEIAAKELNKPERMALEVLQAGSEQLIRCLKWDSRASILAGEKSFSDFHARKVLVGKSDVADAWTDGVSRIWISKSLLKLTSGGISGNARLAMLLLHEYMHDAPDTDSHIHDTDFYRRIHDLAIDTDIIGMTAKHMVHTVVKVMRDAKMKVSHTAMTAAVTLDAIEPQAENSAEPVSGPFEPQKQDTQKATPEPAQLSMRL